MDQIYARKTSINSLRNPDKNCIEYSDDTGNGNSKNKRINFLKLLAANWDKYIYTFCILLIYLCYGICQALFPPAMVDMKYLFRTTMTKISYGNTLSAIGYLTGSFCGFSYKYVNRQLSFILNTIILGVFIGVEPLCTSLWQFYLAFFLNSFGGGVWDSGNSVWVVEMWKEHSPPVLNLSQMMYGLGVIIAPLMVKPFIYGDISNHTDTTVTTTSLPEFSTDSSTLVSTTPPSDDDINYSIDRRSKLMIPFMIGGGVTLIGPTILLVMFFIKRYKTPDPLARRVTEPKGTIKTEEIQTIGHSEYSPTIRKVLIVLVALSLTAYAGLEGTFFNYSSTYYQYLPIRLSAPKAAEVMSVLSATYAAGRGLSAIISSKLRPEIMFIYHMIVLSMSLTVLYLGQNSETLIFVGNAMIGFGFSAMWPLYFSFSERHIQLTDRVTSIYSIASALFMLVAPFILGPVIENHPETLLNIEILNFSVVVFLFIVIIIVVKRSKRYPILYTIIE